RVLAYCWLLRRRTVNGPGSGMVASRLLSIQLTSSVRSASVGLTRAREGGICLAESSLTTRGQNSAGGFAGAASGGESEVARATGVLPPWQAEQYFRRRGETSLRKVVWAWRHIEPVSAPWKTIAPSAVMALLFMASRARGLLDCKPFPLCDSLSQAALDVKAIL